ncbi:hypothetical protein LTR17_007244 [Elasticomyces elasticus]|nr:hypothetical protein LTR17_007244 [Elasticomyces elasticus]
MRTFAFVGLLVAFLCSLGAALEVERTIGVYVWPVSATKATNLARITYNSTTATVDSYTRPSIPADEETVRVGFYHESGAWSGIATASSNFALEKNKKLQLHLNNNGELYHVGFKASDYGTSSKVSNTKDGVSVELLKIRPGPTPHLNKPVVVNPDGSVPAKEPEKSFLQKYWWAIAGFMLLQVVMSSSKGE